MKVRTAPTGIFPPCASASVMRAAINPPMNVFGDPWMKASGGPTQNNLSPIRAAGLPYDIRKAEPYCIYDRFDFDIPTLPESDIYARYYIRLLEARESVKILQQALRDLPKGETLGGKGGYVHRAPEGEVYHRVEAPKGEFGVYLVADGSNKPYRCKIRAPGFAHLQAMDFMNRGHMLADVSAILGSLDIVFGEIDR